MEYESKRNLRDIAPLLERLDRGETLSGTTTAAWPSALRMVLMCWRKLSCLLELVVQKSWRL